MLAFHRAAEACTETVSAEERQPGRAGGAAMAAEERPESAMGDDFIYPVFYQFPPYFT